MSNSPASWFETHASGALLTTRKKDLILRSALARVSKDGQRVAPPHSRGAIRPGFAQAVPSRIRGRRECRARRAHPQPRVRFVTIAKRPSRGDGMRIAIFLFLRGRQVNFGKSEINLPSKPTPSTSKIGQSIVPRLLRNRTYPRHAETTRMTPNRHRALDVASGILAQIG
jgi:hypothetical protein